MKDEAALRPTVFNFQSYVQQKPPVEEDPTVEEQILAAGADKVFWQTLKKQINNAIQQLEQINEGAIANGAPPQQIGENAIILCHVKAILRKVINGVEDAREARDGKQS